MSAISMNEAYFNTAFRDFVAEGGDPAMAESAATTRLVEKCIREKDYVVYSHDIRDSLGEFDVICTFNFAGDPLFGLYRYGDEDKIVFGGPDGLHFRHL